MAGRIFELTEDTLSVIEEIGGHMPGGLFIYKADGPGELIYANKPVFDIYGCADLNEFRALTGFTFLGMVHPEDYDRVCTSIIQQISTNEDHMDYAEYRITRKDGKIRWVDDYGHYCQTKVYGGIYVVFISDITLLQARDKSLSITYNHDSVRHYKVNADELRIEQVLVNIISNAIKYTPSGKTVDLIAEEEAGAGNRNRYRFIIRDTGIGISEDYLPYIFESFTREEKTTVNRIQGTGLGLAITAKVVELMGGTIQVQSTVGEGSEFVVELELESLEHTIEEEGQSADGRTDLSGCHVLLVEDNEINAEIAILILSQYGIEVDLAQNGQSGLEKVCDHAAGYYTAVLMDIQMPVMNGYEATRAIRKLNGDYYQKLPIIAMSANAYDEDVQKCLDSGMNAHIAKPFKPDDLLKLLQEQTDRNDVARRATSSRYVSGIL